LELEAEGGAQSLVRIELLGEKNQEEVGGLYTTVTGYHCIALEKSSLGHDNEGHVRSITPAQHKYQPHTFKRRWKVMQEVEQVGKQSLTSR